MGIFGKKSDHPLADIKSAQQVLESVSKSDALNTVQELTGWIETVLEQAEDFRLDYEFTLLRMFDEAAQPHVRKVLRDYFAVQPLTKFQENRLWTVLNNFYIQTGNVHHDVLTRYRKGERGASSIKPELALLATRSIAILSARMKLAAARYALVEPILWKHLAEIYNHAETCDYENSSILLYAGGAGGNTSVRQEFAVLVMWYGVSAGTQNPLQEHITERLVSYVGKWLSVSNMVNGDGLFVFDLAQPTPPMRVANDSTMHPSLRFIGTGELLNQLNGLFKTLIKGIVPDDLHMGGANYEAELIRGILSRLIDNLTQPLPTRRNPRRKINVSLKVASGLFKILEHADVVKMLENVDADLNFKQEEIDTWEVEDISATGFRSVVPVNRADGIKIGSLIGSKPENIKHWGAGIVRRLSRDDKNYLHIGVEVLSPQIIGVSVVDRGHSSSEGQVALYLNRSNDTSGEAWLLMRPDTFSPNRSLDMEMNSVGYLLLPLALVESGTDYDLARYRRMEQDPSGH